MCWLCVFRVCVARIWGWRQIHLSSLGKSRYIIFVMLLLVVYVDVVVCQIHLSSLGNPHCIRVALLLLVVYVVVAHVTVHVIALKVIWFVFVVRVSVLGVLVVVVIDVALGMFIGTM